MRALKHVVVGCAIAAATFGVGSLAIATAQEEGQEPENAVEAADSLNCANGAPIYLSPHRDYPAGSGPETFATPEEALRRRLQDERDDLDAADFQRTVETSEEIQFTIENNGRQATAYAVRIGNEWAVISFAVCDNYRS